MNDVQGVPHSRLTTIRSAALLLLACLTMGALVGCLFGLLCGGLNDLLHWKIDSTIVLGMGFALAGAATGVILGVLAMIDRLMNAKYWEDRSTRPRKRDRVRAMLATALKSRRVELDGNVEVSPETSSVRDSASRNGCFL